MSKKILNNVLNSDGEYFQLLERQPLFLKKTPLQILKSKKDG